MRKAASKLTSALDELNHPDLDHILLVVQQSKPSTLLSKSEVQSLIFDSFLDQCQRFLSQQSKFHHFSEKICIRATDIINQIDKIQKYNKVSAKPEVESDIERILTKTQLNAGREETLAKILEHLQISDDMVKKIVDPRAEVDSAFFEAVDMLDKQKLLIITLESFGESKLVESIKKSRGSLVNVAITKVLKNLNKLTDVSDFDLLLKYKKLLGDNEENKRKFEQAIMNTRKQLSKNYFAPIISELNYSLKKPVEEYYSQIFNEVLNKFNDQRYFLEKLFPETKSKLLSELTSSFVLEVYFRLQRCFFKAMQPLSLCKIKTEYLKYYKQLRSMLGTEQYKSVHMESSLAKLDECIESVIKTQSQKMTKSKYNIYSVAGYMGIADNLKILLECYNLDDKNSRWIEPFYRLAQSRIPTQSNKSLVIFSINIWEIYLKVFGYQNIEFESVDVKQKAAQMINKGSQIFLNMNKKQFVDKILSGSQQIPDNQKETIEILLKVCSSDIKKILHSQLSLIIHQNIRSSLKQKLNDYVLDYYRKMIQVAPPIKNQQLKLKCQQIGINIKTLGRAADTVEISTEEQMISILQ